MSEMFAACHRFHCFMLLSHGATNGCGRFTCRTAAAMQLGWGLKNLPDSYRVAPQRYCLVWSNNAFTMPKCHTQRFVHISAQVLHCRDKEQGF